MSLVQLLATFLFSAVSAAIGTWMVIRAADRAGLIDRPNERSSHVRPTPRGGGLAVIIVLLVAASWSALDGSGRGWLAVIPPLIAVALVGLVDDRRGVSPGARLAVHVAATAWVIGWLGRDLSFGIGWLDGVPWLPQILTAIACVWLINAYNFMDGIDGIAGMQGLFAGVLLAAALFVRDADPWTITLASALGGACLGFLVWNWAPAKIFLGDVGSGAIGLAIAAIAVLSWVEGALSPWTALLVVSLFLADATATLLRRMLRGEVVHAAHRTHAYQWLARRWGGHGRVTLAYALVNVIVVAPLFWWAEFSARDDAPLAAGLAFVILMGVAWLLGSGRPEDRSSS